MELARWDRAYDRLLASRPDDGELWTARGQYHALRDRWAQAAADFARGVHSAPTTSEEWFDHACLRLMVGDEEGYRAAVHELRRLAGGSDDPYVAYVLARTTAIAAEPAVEREQTVRWAEHAVAGNPYAWRLHVLGLALYRAGRFDEAIRRLEESKARPWTEQGPIQNPLVLAMAHYRLGRAAQARALLDEVERWWKEIDATRIDGAVAARTVDWLPLQLLRREAEALILHDPAFPADPFAS
jgi:Flp pilus assembly protein TadD